MVLKVFALTRLSMYIMLQLFDEVCSENKEKGELKGFGPIIALFILVQIEHVNRF